MLKTRINAENGNLNEQVDLALQLLDSNNRDPSNLAKQLAFQWFSVTAEQGDLESVTAIGIAYLEGTGVNRDFEESFSWLSKAAAKNHPESFGKLGKWYENEQNPKRDIDKAKEYYLKAIELGDKQAKTDLAGLFLEHGSKKEMNEAIKIIKPLADEEHPYATFLLGFAHLLGKGVDREEGTGIRLLKKASNLKCKNADDVLSEIPESIRDKYN
jgi:TPR repeat protein